MRGALNNGGFGRATSFLRQERNLESGETIRVDGVAAEFQGDVVPLEQTPYAIRFLLIGNQLDELRIISPADGRFEEIPDVKPADANKMRVLVLSPFDLKTHKQVLLQRGNDRPFLLTIPEFDPKPPAPPKALGTI